MARHGRGRCKGVPGHWTAVSSTVKRHQVPASVPRQRSIDLESALPCPESLHHSHSSPCAPARHCCRLCCRVHRRRRCRCCLGPYRSRRRCCCPRLIRRAPSSRQWPLALSLSLPPDLCRVKARLRGTKHGPGGGGQHVVLRRAAAAGPQVAAHHQGPTCRWVVLASCKGATGAAAGASVRQTMRLPALPPSAPGS